MASNLPAVFGGQSIYAEPEAGMQAAGYTPSQTPPLPGKAQGVYIVIHPAALEELSAQFASWFETYPDVVVVDQGTSDKQYLGFMIIEWLECEVDRLFLTILDQEEAVGDYTVYGRDLED